MGDGKFPRYSPDVDLDDGNILHTFAVGDLVVPLIAFDHTRFECDLENGGDQDDTGMSLWPASSLVVSILMRCHGLLEAANVLEIGSGSAFCGLVARQIAMRVVLSDREPAMRQLAGRNLTMQTAEVDAATTVRSFGWAENDAWPKERFEVILASDVLYGYHHSMRTCPDELARFSGLLESSLAPGGIVIIGHVERNCLARADLQVALQQQGFTVQLMHPSECGSAAMPRPPAHGGVVFLCSRAGEGTRLVNAASAAAGEGGRLAAAASAAAAAPKRKLPHEELAVEGGADTSAMRSAQKRTLPPPSQ